MPPVARYAPAIGRWVPLAPDGADARDRAIQIASNVRRGDIFVPSMTGPAIPRVNLFTEEGRQRASELAQILLDGAREAVEAELRKTD